MGYWKDTFFAGWTQGIKEGITFEDKMKMSCNNCKYCTEFLYCTYWCCAALNFEKEDAEVCKKFIKKDE